MKKEDFKSDPFFRRMRKFSYVFYGTCVLILIASLIFTDNDYGVLLLFPFFGTMFSPISIGLTRLTALKYKADLRYFFKTHYEMVKNTKSYEDYKLALKK